MFSLKIKIDPKNFCEKDHCSVSLQPTFGGIKLINNLIKFLCFLKIVSC